MKKVIITGCYILSSYCSIASGVAITATGVGVTQTDACQTAKSNLRLQTRGTVTGQGTCSCEKRQFDWICGINGEASK